MPTISHLYVYPVKSLAGIALTTAQLTQTGFEWDRYWMLIDENNRLVSQREVPELVLFRPALTEDHLIIHYQDCQISIPKKCPADEKIACQLFSNTVYGILADSEINGWFSKQLGRPVRLVYKAEDEVRLVKNHPDAMVNFPDSCPYLILGQSSLDHLNEKLENPVEMIRFRPNIVFSGGAPHAEDDWETIKIGNAQLGTVKKCGRCKMTTVDPQKGSFDTEPLPTLATYRRVDRKIAFGQYFKLLRGGTVSLGDELT